MNSTLEDLPAPSISSDAVDAIVEHWLRHTSLGKDRATDGDIRGAHAVAWDCVHKDICDALDDVTDVRVAAHEDFLYNLAEATFERAFILGLRAATVTIGSPLNEVARSSIERELTSAREAILSRIDRAADSARNTVGKRFRT